MVDVGLRRPGLEAPRRLRVEERRLQHSFRVQPVSEDAAGADHVLSLEQVLTLLHQDLPDHRELLPDRAGVAFHGDGRRRLGQHHVRIEPDLHGRRMADVLGEEVDVRVRVEPFFVRGRVERPQAAHEGVVAYETVDRPGVVPDTEVAFHRPLDPRLGETPEHRLGRHEGLFHD